MNDLHDLLHDAVADVEPADRLSELRARTADPVRAAARPWWWAAGATVLATAAAVTVVAVVSDGSDAPAHHHHDMAMDPPASTQLVAAYFVGDTAYGGPRLYREFDQVPVGDPLQAALDRIERPADDPDYRTPWTPDTFGTVTRQDDGIHVELHRNRLGDALEVQQVVYTLQAAAGEQLPVWFERDTQRGSAPVTAAPQLDVLNPVSISDPAEGNEYAGSFTARGRVGSAERTVNWNVVLGEHTIVASGTATIDAGEGSFSPWSAEVDVSGLAPGRYTLVATTSDTGYAVTYADTRTINVR